MARQLHGAKDGRGFEALNETHAWPPMWGNECVVLVKVGGRHGVTWPSQAGWLYLSVHMHAHKVVLPRKRTRVAYEPASLPRPSHICLPPLISTPHLCAHFSSPQHEHASPLPTKYY